MKTKRNRKWKISHTVSEGWPLCFSSHKNCKLKVKLRWVGARDRNNSTFFVPFILSEWNFFSHLCLISMYSLLNTLSEHTYFQISKTLLHTLFCLLVKFQKAFSVSLKGTIIIKWYQTFIINIVYKDTLHHSLI